MRSIRRRLAAHLLLGGTVLCILLAGAVALRARSQVGELLDYQLEQVARTLIDRDLSDLDTKRGDDPSMHLEIQVGDDQERLLYTSNPDLALPLSSPLGLTSVADRSGQYDEGLRVFTLRGEHRIVQVIQPMSLRNELAWEAGVGAMIPALLVFAVLSVFIVATIQRELAPLRRLSEELEARGADALDPIDLLDAPAELRGPVSTLNGLLGRLDRAIRTHREFIADAAHALRSPLTAIRLQAENIAAATADVERRSAIVELTRGVDRASHLVQQLLTLARLEPKTTLKPRRRVDLRAVAQQCLVDHAGVAAAKGMQLGLSAHDAGWVTGDGEALRIMLDNLLDNALKYAPPNTPLEIAIRPEGSWIVLAVRDHGPGIPAPARESVFARFHRLADSEMPGSGLGLAIVAAVVRGCAGTISLRDPPQGGGLLAEVRLPAAIDSETGAAPPDE